MASMWSVAKFLTLTRRAAGAAAGDKEVVKTPTSPPPLPAPVASEVGVIPNKPAPEPTVVSPLQLPSRTQSEVAPTSVPGPASSESPRDEDTTTPSESTGQEAVVHEPEETHSLSTMVESKPPSERKGSKPPSLRDLPIGSVLVEPPTPEGEQRDDGAEEKQLPQTQDVTTVEPLSEKESPPIDSAPTYADAQEQKPDSQDSTRAYELDLGAALLEKERFANEIRRLQNELGRLREGIRAITLAREETQRRAEVEKTEVEERTRREMEDVRRACEENEEVARRETQRVKALIAVERHSHSERVKEFKEEKDELVAGVETARKETQRIKALIAVERHSHNERMKELDEENDELMAVHEAAQSNLLVSATQVETQKERIRVLEGLLDDRTREVGRLREDIKAVILEKEEAIRKAEVERVEMEKRLRAEMEDVRHVCEENEEAAKKETQRIKGLIAAERHSHSERVKEFKEEKHGLISELETARKETQRIKGLIAVERHSHSEQVKELKAEKDELIAGLEAARKETQRIKGLIAVERHSHGDRVKEFTAEKDKLVAGLETAKKETQQSKDLIAVERQSHSEEVKGLKEELSAVVKTTQSKVLAFVTRIESQKEQIRSLEGRLEDHRTATQKFQEKYQERERTEKQLQEEIVEERLAIQSLKETLVEMRTKANRVERDNRLLREEVAQLKQPVAAVGRFVSSFWS